MRFNPHRFDKLVNDTTWNVYREKGYGQPVSVVEVFHNIKNKPETYKAFSARGTLRVRQKINRYDFLVPKIKGAMDRLRVKGLMSDKQKMW